MSEALNINHGATVASRYAGLRPVKSTDKAVCRQRSEKKACIRQEFRGFRNRQRRIESSRERN